MYYNKLTKQEKQMKLGKLQRERLFMENDPISKKMLSEWHKFLQLSPTEKKRRRDAWESYYKLVNESTMALLLREQQLALQQQNFARVKQLAEEAYQMIKNNDNVTLPKPDFIDPFEFDYGVVCMSYKNLQKAIKELTDYSPDDYIEGARIFSQ